MLSDKFTPLLTKMDARTQEIFDKVRNALPGNSQRQQDHLISKIDAYIVVRQGLEQHIDDLAEKDREIRELLLKYGIEDTIVIDGYSFKVVHRTAPTVSWNTKALDTLARQEPDKYGWLLDYRKETAAKDYATITPTLKSKF